jgi:hypothetical protein
MLTRKGRERSKALYSSNKASKRSALLHIPVCIYVFPHFSGSFTSFTWSIRLSSSSRILIKGYLPRICPSSSVHSTCSLSLLTLFHEPPSVPSAPAVQFSVASDQARCDVVLLNVLANLWSVAYGKVSWTLRHGGPLPKITKNPAPPLPPPSMKRYFIQVVFQKRIHTLLASND